MEFKTPRKISANHIINSKLTAKERSFVALQTILVGVLTAFVLSIVEKVTITAFIWLSFLVVVFVLWYWMGKHVKRDFAEPDPTKV